MGEGKTNMFGKTYNTIGSTDSNFIIKTKGDLKVQWGGKFIDIIKNGKIASSSANILKTASSSDDISDNGIYLIPTEEGNEVWISIDGTKVNLAGEVGTTYVSFLTEQKEVTPDQKYTALTNAGLYYESLQDALDIGVKTGLVYTTNEGKLYIFKDGVATDYYIAQDSTASNTNELVIGDLKIYNSNESSIFETSRNNIQIIINGKRYVTYGKDLVVFDQTVEMGLNTIIQSTGANSKQGYRLYDTIKGSYLEVDNIIWRNRPDSDTRTIEDYYVLTSSNIIVGAELKTENSVDNKLGTVSCQLKYVNQFLKDQYVYIFISDKADIPTISVEGNIILISTPVTEQIDLLITYEGGQQDSVSILAGQSSVEFAPKGNIQTMEITSQFNEVVFSDSSDVSKALVLECKILSIEGQKILLEVDVNYIDKLYNSIIGLLNSPQIKIEDNNIYLLDRSKLVQHEDSVEEFDKTIHSQIGTIKESEIDFLKPPESIPDEYPPGVEQEESTMGIYSDNFIGINSKLYDTVFKKKLLYPSYDKELNIPEKVTLEEKYDQIVPNIKWIKEIMKLVIPPGTIAMFNGQSEIPEGWAVCDGTNGTPNLVGKFIKAVASADEVGDNDSILDENNELILSQDYLPKHSHPHKAHTHSLSGNLSGTTGSSGDLSVSLEYSDYNWGIEPVSKTFVTSVTGEGITTETGTVDGVSNIKTQGGTATGGSHTHSISLETDGEGSLSSTTSEEQTLSDSEWPNKPLKIEPRSYSLVFIMKL